MQTKLLSAAAVVAGTKALTIEQHTELAQVDGPGHHGHDHHGHDHYSHGHYGHDNPCSNHRYGYECLHQTVEEVLGELKDDVVDHKQECLVKADDLREDIVDLVKDSREGQVAELERIKEMIETHQTEALGESMSAIGAAFDDAVAA